MPSKKRRVTQADVVHRFAARLRDRRTAAGLTQAALARAAHLTLTYVGRLEAAGAEPGIDTVARLAAALGTTAHDLLPEPVPADAAAAHRDQARAALGQVLRDGDPDLVRAVAAVLSHMAQGLARGR